MTMPNRKLLNLPATNMRPTKLGKKVSDHLRKEILEGRLKPGQNLPGESDLMEAFGVSRPTLREAIRILESLGLIVVYRGKKGGAEVRLPTIAVTATNAAIYLQSQAATFFDLQQARACIEPTLIVLLADKIKKGDFKELRRHLDEAGESLDNPQRYARAITDYHATLFALLGNKVLNLIAGVVHNVYQPMIAEQIAAFSDVFRRKSLLKGVRAQLVLLDLMEQGKFEEAGYYCRENLQRIGRELVKSGRAEKLIDAQYGTSELSY